LIKKYKLIEREKNPQKKKKKKTCVKKRLQQHSFLVGFWFPQEAG